jgi:hypothetical protein
MAQGGPGWGRDFERLALGEGGERLWGVPAWRGKAKTYWAANGRACTRMGCRGTAPCRSLSKSYAANLAVRTQRDLRRHWARLLYGIERTPRSHVYHETDRIAPDRRVRPHCAATAGLLGPSNGRPPARVRLPTDSNSRSIAVKPSGMRAILS